MATDTDQIILKKRISGAFLGQYIGDAFGTLCEFSSSEESKRRLNLHMGPNKFIPIVGSGPFQLVPGQVTDDTELAMGLVDAVIKYNGDIDSVRENAANNYIKWYKSCPFDIGTTTRSALCGNSPKAVCDNAYKYNQNSKSNGCLMRSFAMGILGYILEDSELNALVCNDCSLTNPNPVAIDAVRVFTFAIKNLLKNGDRVSAYDEAIRVCSTNEIRECLVAAKVRGDDIPCNGNLVKTDSNYQGYVGVAIQNAFYELLNGKTFYQSIVDIVSRGGDTDTTGCIAGALLGAYYGEDHLPMEWIYTVKGCDNPRTYHYDLINHSKIDDNIDGLCKVVMGK